MLYLIIFLEVSKKKSGLSASQPVEVQQVKFLKVCVSDCDVKIITLSEVNYLTDSNESLRTEFNMCSNKTSIQSNQVSGNNRDKLHVFSRGLQLEALF